MVNPSDQRVIVVGVSQFALSKHAKSDDLFGCDGVDAMAQYIPGKDRYQ